MSSIRLLVLLVFLFTLGLAGPAAAQLTPVGATMAGSSGPSGATVLQPRPFEILGISVEGVEEESMRTFVLQSSGLAIGQTVNIPGDLSIADAIRNIYQLRVFSDVKIVEERRAGEGVFLVIRVKEEPQLGDYTFSGVKKKHSKELQKKIPLFKGSRVRPADLERSRQVIKEYFAEKGYMLADVEVKRTETPQNTLLLDFAIDRGPQVEIADIVLNGNTAVSSGKVRRKMKETKRDRWWQFWKKSRFDRSDYEDDKTKVIEYYNTKGFYDARIVSDSVYLDTTGKKPGMIVEMEIHEGPQYHIRNIEWEGNTVYPNEMLTAALGLEKGDVYNTTRLDQNLNGNRSSSDVASLYMNRGHMLFRVQEEVRVVGDSLDLHFDVYEGDIFTFGNVSIAGNLKTKEHVIRRELYTVPGQTFSRELIQETVRRLSQLNYFDQEKLGGGPGISLDQDKKLVDLTYKLEEVGSDQLELSGTYGRFGLVLMLRFGFNNFSLQDVFKKGSWKPLPSGDGQRLSVSLQTNGTAYQSYTLGFTEPWFRGKPTPVGFTLSHSRFNGSSFYTYSSSSGNDTGQKFIRTSASVFYEQRLKWPDDKFSTSTSLGYQYFLNRDFTSSLPGGTSQQVTVRQALTRSSLDHPVFPTSGSSMELSLEIAPPVGNFIQYHKWRFNSGWNVPLTRKLTLGVTGEFGYIGSITGDDVLFERYVVGGSPFDVQGFRDNFGKDIIYMRGFPARALGPRRGDEAVGGRILNKYTSELRFLAVQTPQLTAAPYLFMDAANTWDNFGTYNPTQLYRAAGLGARLFLPILGMLELTYGYNFDEFTPIPGQEGKHNGSNRWLFQFSLGQGFN